MNPGRHTHARVAAAMMFFANGSAFATWASRIPAVQQELHLSAFVLGIALLMMGFGALTAMQLVAKLIGRFGSNRVTATACLLAAVCLVSIAFTRDLYQLCAALFLFGLCSGGMDVAMNANAVTVERLLGRSIMASFHALWSIGSMCGALLGGLLAHEHWGLLQHFGMVACVVAVIGVLGTKFLVGESAATPDAKVETAAPGAPPQAVSTSTSQTIALLAVVCLLAFVSEGAIADWSALYMARDLHTDAGLASIGLACFSAAMTGGRLLGDGVIEKLGDKTTLTAGGGITLIGIFLALLPQAWPFTLIGFFVCGIGLSTQVPITFRVSGRARPDNPGAGVAAVARAGYLGLLLGPPILGFLADSFGLRLSLLSLSLLALLTVLCASRIPGIKS